MSNSKKPAVGIDGYVRAAGNASSMLRALDAEYLRAARDGGLKAWAAMAHSMIDVLAGTDYRAEIPEPCVPHEHR